MLKELTNSLIEVSRIDGKSVVTGSKVFRPLKAFSLHKGNACHIIFSNYGGGFVEGDCITADLVCKEDTITAFSSQANTRIYRSENGLYCKQTINGYLGDRAMAVFVGDPLVPHKNSLFEQKLQWDLCKDSVLLFVDWFEAGRILNGEKFAFQSFATDLKIDAEGRTLVWDRFKIDPMQTNLNSPGAFLDHSSYLNIFLAGHENLERVKKLENELRFLARKYFQEEKVMKMNEFSLIGSAVKVNENVFLIRCSSKNNEFIYPFVKELSQALSQKDLLGFNPLEGRV